MTTQRRISAWALASAALLSSRLPAGESDPVLYELVPGDSGSFTGSFFVDDCLPCAKPTIPVPLAGTFLLRVADGGGAGPIRKYTVEGIDLYTTSEQAKYVMSGEGSYACEGQVSLLQSMELTLVVNGEEGVILARDAVAIPEDVVFPNIEIELEHLNPVSEFHVYSMILVARPAAVSQVEFRRGDSNADGGVDISDAVFILNWLFAGSQGPTCLDAADSNADGQHDLSDALRLILFLFQGAPEPPWPGAFDCAAPEQPIFGCEEYLTC